MWKTIIGKFGEKVIYGFGFGLGMGLSFKMLSVKNIKRQGCRLPAEGAQQASSISCRTS